MPSFTDKLHPNTRNVLFSEGLTLYFSLWNQLKLHNGISFVSFTVYDCIFWLSNFLKTLFYSIFPHLFGCSENFLRWSESETGEKVEWGKSNVNLQSVWLLRYGLRKCWKLYRMSWPIFFSPIFRTREWNEIEVSL